MSEEGDIRRAILFLEYLQEKASRERDTSIYADATGMAFLAAKAAIEKHGYELTVSPGGVTWKKKGRKTA